MNRPFYSLGLTGYPLGHSLSPRLHAAALKAMGLAGEYRLCPVEPGDGQDAGLRALCHRLRTGELHGLNVTVPHKTAVTLLVDELMPTARSVRAANTLLLRDGRLLAENTDVPGFLTDLKRVFPQLFPVRSGNPPVLVLGAGGAARAVVYALVSTGWLVRVAARRWEDAAHLCASLPYLNRKQPLPLSAEGLNRCLDDLCLVVNTTSAGMAPVVDTSPWPAGLPLPPRAPFYDLIYAPLETRLLRQARENGLPTANGLGMLVEQAALALELWTGRPVPRAAMWAELL